MPDLFEENFRLLQKYHPHVARSVAKVNSSPRLSLAKARSGVPIPLIRRENHSSLALHSTFDPLKEGERLLNLHSSGNFLCFLGLGGGYQIFPFLRQSRANKILIIEDDPRWFRVLLENFSYLKILSYPYLTILLTPTRQQIVTFLLSAYLPTLDGGVETIPLRPYVNEKRLFFQQVTTSLRMALEHVKKDLSAQACFGKRWFKNAVANLSLAQKSQGSLTSQALALITAAGPSLEESVPFIKKYKPRATLLATDTSLPTLLAYDIEPDIVVSLDCQQIGYLHFFQDLPKKTQVALDLFSPPHLARLRGEHSCFFATSHPLALYLSKHFRSFPSLDSSGVNVTQAALSLATLLGVRKIHLLGADFSYPEGKPYARESYLFPLFLSHQKRTSPLESLFFHFVMRDSRIKRLKTDRGITYVPPIMEFYRSHLVTSNLRWNSVTPLGPSKGFLFSGLKNHPSRSFPQKMTPGPLRKEARTLLDDYRKAILTLPDQISADSLTLWDRSRRELLLSLLPTLAAIQKEEGEKSNNLLTLKMWCCRCLERGLTRSF